VHWHPAGDRSSIAPHCHTFVPAPPGPASSWELSRSPKKSVSPNEVACFITRCHHQRLCISSFSGMIG
jgi:hypothetical protein